MHEGLPLEGVHIEVAELYGIAVEELAIDAVGELSEDPILPPPRMLGWY